MADIAELERRVTALEAEVRSDRRDLRRVLLMQESTLSSVEVLNRRMAALELTVEANARTTERGFAELNEQLVGLKGCVFGMERRLSAVEGEIVVIKSDIAAVKGQIASLDAKFDALPRIIAEMLREPPIAGGCA